MHAPCRSLASAVFISRVNDCPACSDTEMLSDSLIYLAVSLPQFQPAPLLPLLFSLKAFRSCLIFPPFFFNLNLNSPLDSVARQNKLFKSFNEEVQSTDSGVQTHLKRRRLTSYRCGGRCVRLCVVLVEGGCVTTFICEEILVSFLRHYSILTVILGFQQ